MFGNCRLCLQQSELQDSHLLPRALYRIIGTASDRIHPDTVQLTPESQKRSSEQARRNVLCSRCEQCFNENGERWVLQNCYRGRGRFRLRAELRNRTSLFGAEFEAYSASKEEAAKLSYFCLSIVWRASLCEWICRGERYEQINLGPYQEEIRQYLMSGGMFPKLTSVVVILSALERPVLAMSLPTLYRVDSLHCYRFHIPGMSFVASVGGREQEHTLSVLLPPHPILITPEGDKLVQAETLALLGRVPPRGFEAPLVDGTEIT